MRHNFPMGRTSVTRPLAVLAWLTAACAGGAAEAPPPKKVAAKPRAAAAAQAPAPPPAPVGVPAPSAAPGSIASGPEAPGGAAAVPAAEASALPDKPGFDGKLPSVIDGQDIPRPALLAVLSGGVGRFLQTIRVEPSLERGRFTGWRLLRVFDAAQAGPAGLRPGDVVQRVNGQSIERPEQFKNVWDSLATESLLILQVERGGQRSEIRHRILQ